MKIAGIILVIDHSRRARKFAEKFGLAAELLSAPPGRNKIASCIRPIEGGYALAVRFFGFSRKKDNGWTVAAAPTREAVERIRDGILSRCNAFSTEPLGGRN